MAVLIAMTLVVASATSAATTAVVLLFHMPAHHKQVQAHGDAWFLQHHDVHWSHPWQY
jgi:hypothetical protein